MAKQFIMGALMLFTLFGVSGCAVGVVAVKGVTTVVGAGISAASFVVETVVDVIVD